MVGLALRGKAAVAGFGAALIAAAGLEGGRVYWPKYARRLGEWEQELLNFSNGRHDDQAGTFAYAAPQTSRRSTIDFDALAEALDQPDLLNPHWLF